MDSNILNIEQATEFLGVSEKTLIKLLREEHLPARKIGREWRFSRSALIDWLAGGDSIRYANQSEPYIVSKDTPGKTAALFKKINESLADVKNNGNNIKALLPDLNEDTVIPKNAALRVSFKRQRDVEKLEFKIFWTQPDDTKSETDRGATPAASEEG